jgi:hypothetical protein
MILFTVGELSKKYFLFILLQLERERRKQQFTIKEDHRREKKERKDLCKKIIFIRSGHVRRSGRRDR